MSYTPNVIEKVAMYVIVPIPILVCVCLSFDRIQNLKKKKIMSLSAKIWRLCLHSKYQ